MNTILDPPDYVGPALSWDAATPCSAPVFSSPIPGVNEKLVLRQDFQQWNEDWAALALDTAHPDYAAFLLVEESERADIGGGAVRWTRTYAKIPATHNDPSSISYEFPGYQQEAGGEAEFSGYTAGRDTLSKTVPCRIESIYFLLAGDISDLVPVEEQTYWGIGGPGFPVTGKILGSGSTPTKLEWIEEYVAAGAEICVSTTRYDRWMGNIVRGQTIYARAQ